MRGNQGTAEAAREAYRSLRGEYPPSENGKQEAKLGSLLGERVLLGQDIRDGIEPPEELVPDLLLKGKVHSIYSGAGTGKTFLMLWLVLRVLERDLPVIVVDMENGRRIIAERLKDLGANPEDLDHLLHYYPSPDLDPESYALLLEEIDPALVVFDSWINFLAREGYDENSSNDVASWAVSYTHPARKRGCTVLLLDHIPKEGVSSRGSGRKKDEVDVMWALKNPYHFDRDTVGRITLSLEKDREGWLPQTQGFALGGGEDGFVFSRSEGLIEEEDASGLTNTERKTLEALEEFGDQGAEAAEWKKAADKRKGVSRASFFRAKAKLHNLKKAVERSRRWYAAGVSKPPNPSERVSRSHSYFETAETQAESHGKFLGEADKYGESATVSLVSRQSHETSETAGDRESQRRGEGEEST